MPLYAISCFVGSLGLIISSRSGPKWWWKWALALIWTLVLFAVTHWR
jgi:hypothetical protein